MKKVTKSLLLSYLFFAIAYFSLFFVFNNSGYKYITSSWFNYILILVNLGFGLLILLFNLISKHLITLIMSFLALVFTAIADYFLVIHNYYYFISVLVFIIAQLCYLIRIMLINKWSIKYLISTISLRVLLSISLIITIICMNKFSMLNLAVAIYFPILVGNTFDSLSAVIFKKHKIFNLICFIGFALFTLCDLFVGFMNLGYSFSNRDIIWTFYIPSQILLTISMFYLALNKK